jgi:flagellin
MLLSALTINTAAGQVSVGANFSNAVDYATKGSGQIRSFAASSTSAALALSVCDAEVYTQALENIATLRAANGGSVSRLMFAEEAAQQRRTNLEAAHGRIMDVDIASESTALAKHTILVQASASMLSQANQSQNIALQLLG